MPLTIGNIRDNFQEIYCAVQNAPPDGQPKLIANFCGNRIYDATRGWGRIWKCIYNIVWIFDGGSLQQRKLKQAVEKTLRSFNEKQSLIVQSNTQYKQYMADRCAGKHSSESDAHKARFTIRAWSDGILPFSKLLQSQDERLNRFLQQMAPAEIKENALFTPVVESAQKECDRYQHLIKLEGILEGPLPYEALAWYHKEYRGKQKSEKEQQAHNAAEAVTRELSHKAIEQWIGDIYAHAKEIDVQTIHNALRSFVEHLIGPEATAREVAMHTAYLNSVLRSSSFSEKFPEWTAVFVKKDPEHMEWRGRIQEGTVIQCNDRMIKLGKQLGKKVEEQREQVDKKAAASVVANDNNLLFEIEGDVNRVVWISLNRAILGIKLHVAGKFIEETRYRKYAEDIQPLELLEIDTEGRCAIIERLYTPLNKVVWQSREYLSDTDAKIVHCLTKYLKQVQGQNEMPRFFTASHVMLNSNQELRFAKIPSLIPTDFTALARFAFEASTGNFTVYQHMITKSGLHSHKSATFFREVVERTLLGTMGEARQMAAKRLIDDPRIVKQADALSKKVLEWKESCRKTVELHLPANADRVKVERVLNEKLLGWYDETRSVCEIWPVDVNVLVGRVLREAR